MIYQAQRRISPTELLFVMTRSVQGLHLIEKALYK